MTWSPRRIWVMTPSTRSNERLPLLTRNLVTRVRLLALEAQVAAGGPPRPGQLERAVEHLVDHATLPATANPPPAIAGELRRPDRHTGKALLRQCCSSEKEEEKKTKKNPNGDKMIETRLLEDEFEKKKTVAVLRQTLLENAARWKVKLDKKRTRRKSPPNKS